MRKYLFIKSLIAFLFIGVAITARSQERVAPLQHNPFVRPQIAGLPGTAKTSALSLPFFEDFDQYDIIPDTNKWIGRQVYVNNTMCDNPVSRGCATFDAISQYGLPYDTVNPYTLRYADSLTSKAIDLSSFVPADSIYMSFLFQPGGKGFLPDRFDSLMLFFRQKTGGVWRKVWSLRDTTNHDFQQVMIAISDTSYLYSDFQFRFVNKASVAANDDVWNVDYIRINKGRNRYDTLINDVAFTLDPTPLLGDYYSMPYRQYIASASAERAGSINSALRNNFTGTQSVGNTGFIASDAYGTVLNTAGTGSKTIGGRNAIDLSTGSYSTTPSAGYYERVLFHQRFWMDPVAGDNNRTNDTIVKTQVFDNYLAYDDGTAEMSYYLNLFPTLPGKIAIEHHLNRPDTLKGMAIYFARQVPTASYKYVNLVVYQQIAYGSSSSDKVLYQVDNIQPRYRDTINHFWVYKFDKPVPLPAGTFYIGTTQPALSGSDSLYFGLDRNRKTGNHAYFNVLGVWNPSVIEGAIMMRPILGQDISGSGISEEKRAITNIDILSVRPNPATNQIWLQTILPLNSSFSVLDISGKQVHSGKLTAEQRINLEQLAAGTYLLQVYPPNALPLSTQIQKQ
jgi:hypothetical protein